MGNRTVQRKEEKILILNITCGAMTLERFRELADWLEKAPLTIDNLDLSAQILKGDIQINIKADRIKGKTLP